MSDNNRAGGRVLVRGGDVSPRRMRALALAAVLPLLGACSWFTDFKQQPKIDPWESVSDSIPPRGNPQMSVPVYGSFAPGLVYSREATMAGIEQFNDLQNPTPPTAASLENGRRQFQINCAPCHGVKGDGLGTAVKYGMFPFPLTSGPALSRTDGYIFGMIRNGRNNMPSYNRIEEWDRWDIVNYVRGLQGKLGTTVVAAPVAQPGVNGTAVPGPSESAPTRPAPYWNDSIGAQAMHREHTPGQARDSTAGALPGATTPRTTPTDTTRGRQP